MALLFLLAVYALLLVWIIVDSRERGKGSATARVFAFIWSQTGGAILAFLVVAWWFVREFVGTFLALVWAGEPISPARTAADRAKTWVVFPQEQAAFALTGRGDFELTA